VDAQNAATMMSDSNVMMASVVIPTKNAGPILRTVLNAVVDQITDRPFDVLVVDSGSTDGTIELVQSFPTVRLIQIPPSDFGHGKTRNFAIGKTCGQYIAMLTQDAIPIGRCWLAELIRTIEADDRIAGVFGRHIAHNDASPFTRHELEQHFAGFKTQPVIGLDDPVRYEREEG